MSRRFWTEEERAILREVYAAHHPCRGMQGAPRKGELFRRLPGRTWPSIHNQIVALRLSRTGTDSPPKKRRSAPGLAGKVYESLTRHGPLNSAGLAELLGVSWRQAISALGHLSRKKAIVPGPDRSGWRIASGAVDESRTKRRITQEAGITDEDQEWMRRYREQRLARLRQGDAGEAR